MTSTSTSGPATVVLSASDTDRATVSALREELRLGAEAHGEILSITRGPGFWQGEEDGEAVTIILLLPTAKVNALRTYARNVAEQFGQEAIGFIVAAGADNLVWNRNQREENR